MKCAICESVALSLHFGAPSCKACAAFFRRTVALDITYDCITGNNDCEVNHERRMACKRCRYQKCIDNNMQRYLVQSKKGRPDGNNDVKMSEETTTSSPSSTPFSSTPSTSSTVPLGSAPLDSDEIQKLNEHFFKMDSNLNKSRRMAFTNSRLLDIFSGMCKMPFEKHQLQPFDFRSYRGYQKQEYVMLFNYANTLPGFQDLSNASQNFLFRIACGVDFVISSSYYTNFIGMESNLLINQDGTYIQMMPLPLLGDEPGTELMFTKKEELEKYKNIIKPRVKSWIDFMPLYESLDPSFEENSILKALCCWQTAHFNLQECDKDTVRKQKSLLTQCLLKLCIDTFGEEEGAVRAANIILFSSSICAEVMELVNSLIIMSFFEIMDCDPLINEILSTTTLFS
ncbi:CRE-NHR-78 protein [Caenorhabditis remanei]|uniref:CRE-NHR-78 protein n=1 Tax=Caenorhabditis remanei TaxID=31234 RepID=E3N5K3_CAERE|nr:CRE-NHR-78 protein [Caenorhabditis remanei]